MSYIDPRSYYEYDFWQRQKKSPDWLRGYKAGFSQSTLPSATGEDFRVGHAFGTKARQKEDNPPSIRGGFGYGHGYQPEASD